MAAPTVEEAPEFGAIYDVDPSVILGTCPQCGQQTLISVISRIPKCPKCAADLAGNHVQMGARPYVILGSDEIREWDSTVPAVPLTTGKTAAQRPGAVLVPPSVANGLTKPGYALPSRLRAVNKASVFTDKYRGALEPKLLLKLQEALLSHLWD